MMCITPGCGRNPGTGIYSRPTQTFCHKNSVPGTKWAYSWHQDPFINSVRHTIEFLERKTTVSSPASCLLAILRYVKEFADFRVPSGREIISGLRHLTVD